jgi:DNA-binding GntR family transcriptional regulator
MRMSGFRQQTYSDQVDDYIKGRILSGDLTPDALITQVAIAAELSFSRDPVREAMQKLVREGLIESHPKKGKNVTALIENQISRSSFFPHRQRVDRGTLPTILSGHIQVSPL